MGDQGVHDAKAPWPTATLLLFLGEHGAVWTNLNLALFCAPDRGSLIRDQLILFSEGLNLRDLRRTGLCSQGRLNLSRHRSRSL